MKTFDAVVVGGGPAGSTCAGILQQGGLKVAVFDRARFPRDKVCAGWITPAVVDLLALDVTEYRQGRVFQPITAFRTSVIGGREIETRYPEPISFGIRRYEFDHYLLQRCGAHLMCGQPVSTLRRVSDGWIVNDGVSTPLLVGAGGHFCPVARSLNPRRRAADIVATLEMEVLLRPDQLSRCRVGPETPALYFCPDLKGYGWCFRKENFVNVGLGRQDPRELPGHVHRFLSFLKSRRIVPDDIPPPSRGHAYLLDDGSPRIRVDHAVLLAGDAAGLAYPRSGEGIRPAIESGLLAAQVVLAAEGRYTRDRLEPYSRELGARLSTGRLARLMARGIPGPAVRGLGAMLMRSPWFTRRVLLDRWFLARESPQRLGQRTLEVAS